MEAITHLSFADDTILLSSTRWEEIEVFERILRCFAFVSGLKINLSKSLLVGVRCSVEVTTPLANLLHCKVGKLPMTCLGVRIGAKSKAFLSNLPVYFMSSSIDASGSQGKIRSPKKRFLMGGEG